jgi:hypothetical protein
VKKKTGWVAIAAIGVVYAPHLYADEMPPRCHASADEAARAALQVALPLSERVEYGGVVFAMAGQYCFSVPIAGNDVEVRYQVVLPEGVHLAAMYHTHPVSAPLHRRRRFSDADLALAVRLRVPSYLGVAGTGLVRVFDRFHRVQYQAAR